ncbi:MAG: ATP-grasp domain-containing protein [Candidatus Magasanikbacteria bacterium]
MNLYEFEGKNIFSKFGITVPKSVLLRREDNVIEKYNQLGIAGVVLKAQVLSGKRGKNNGILFAVSPAEAKQAAEKIFASNIRGQYVSAVLMEEKLNIEAEHYLSITYDTNKKQPVLVYSQDGGMDIEDVSEEKIKKQYLDIRQSEINSDIPFANELWRCFLQSDARVVEINPLVKTVEGNFVAADAKIALDEDAFYRHKDWNFEPRTMLGRLPTEREIEVKKIDEGENYYRGTAGKYIEMDGDVAVLFSGGGASIANMDALIQVGLKPDNYTEYSGNPPREKVYQLAKIVLSKPGLRGLWIAGGTANFTDIAATFSGIIDALDEVKPSYPIVIRRAGPNEVEGKRLMEECAKRNNLNLKIFGKEIAMGETAAVLVDMINK